MSKYIEVTGASDAGLATVTRLTLRDFFQQFGEVVQIHKPPSSGDPATDIASVRFANDDQAERAMVVLKSGTALVLGTPIKGEWKAASSARGGRPSSGCVDYAAPVVDSRSFITEARRGRSRSRRGGKNNMQGTDSRNLRNNRGSRRSESRGRNHQSSRRSRSRSRRGAGAGPKRSRSRRSRSRSKSRKRSSRSKSRGWDKASRKSASRERPKHGRHGRDGDSSERRSASRRGSRSASNRKKGARSRSPAPAEPPARGAGLTAEEKAELEDLQAKARDEEKELEELRSLMAASDARIRRLEAGEADACR